MNDPLTVTGGALARDYDTVLAHEHLAVRVERMDDDAEKLLNLGLEGMLFRLDHVSKVPRRVVTTLTPAGSYQVVSLMLSELDSCPAVN